jgi:hypothetical protein
MLHASKELADSALGAVVNDGREEECTVATPQLA